MMQTYLSSVVKAAMHKGGVVRIKPKQHLIVLNWLQSGLVRVLNQ